MPADPSKQTILHLLMGAEGGGCERNCLLFCENSGGFRHAVMTLGPAGEMTAPWQRAAAEVRHLDVLALSRPARARRVRAALGELSEVPAVAMLWHGMLEMPFLLHALRDWRGAVFAHAGNPQTRPARGIDARFLVAERLWPSPHRPTFVCCSEYVARSLERSWYLRRFPRVAVPNGVRPLSGPGHRPRVIAAGEPCIVGMLARLDWIKDHATVLRAVARARASLPGLRLEIAGDGPEKARLTALAAALGIADAVRFLGNVEAIYDTVSGWDVFLYATSAHEGFGNALSEALMCGLPSVVTEVGPIREVCGGDEEGAAVCVPPADPEAMAAALVALVTDLPRREALSTAARARAIAELSAPVFARRYGEIFAGAISGRPSLSRSLPQLDHLTRGRHSLPLMTAPRSHPENEPVAVVQLGARMHYAVPRILQEAGRLHGLFTDLCGTKGWPRLLRCVPPRLLPGSLRRLTARVPQGVPAGRVHSFSLVGMRYQQRLRHARTLEAEALAHLRAGDELARKALSSGLRGAAAVYTFNSAARELLLFARAEGKRSFYEQTIAPVRIERELLAQECLRWPGWEETVDRDKFYDLFQAREQEEWPLADVILCGSEFVRDGIARLGGPVDRCRVVPYGVDQGGEAEGSETRSRQAPTVRRLRILTVGTVTLRKGAPYVARLARALAAEAEFSWAGTVRLLDHGAHELTAAGVRLLGPVPRSQIHEEYAKADLFLLPSVCEGSATASYEALAHGLPVLTTPNSGSPVQDGRNGRIVALENLDLMEQEIRRLHASPEERARLSDAARADSRDLTIAAYGRRLLAALG